MSPGTPHEHDPGRPGPSRIRHYPDWQWQLIIRAGRWWDRLSLFAALRRARDEWHSLRAARQDKDYRLALRSVDEWDDEDRMDDIVVNNVPMFRMEQMDKRNWWLCCYLDEAGDRVAFGVTFNNKTREIEVHVTEYPAGDHKYGDGS